MPNKTSWNKPNGLADGKKVKALRTSLRLKQEELAERVGVSRVTISRWENGVWAVSPEHQEKLDQQAAG